MSIEKKIIRKEMISALRVFYKITDESKKDLKQYISRSCTHLFIKRYTLFDQIEEFSKFSRDYNFQKSYVPKEKNLEDLAEELKYIIQEKIDSAKIQYNNTISKKDRNHTLIKTREEEK